jgi:nicotinamide mononucleotide transporter
MTPLEIGANAVTALSIVLAGRNSVHTWWTGIVGCILFAWLFFESQLYADVTLQAFFVATSLWGWWHWQHGGNGGEERPVTQAPRAWVLWALFIGAGATAGYGALLHRFTDAYAPFVDSAVLAFSVVAQVLLMQRRVTAWPFWLLVNCIACPLYASRGLHLTAVLYAAYGVNALVAWRHWLRVMHGQQQERAEFA